MSQIEWCLIQFIGIFWCIHSIYPSIVNVHLSRPHVMFFLIGSIDFVIIFTFPIIGANLSLKQKYIQTITNIFSLTNALSLSHFLHILHTPSFINAQWNFYCFWSFLFKCHQIQTKENLEQFTRNTMKASRAATTTTTSKKKPSKNVEIKTKLVWMAIDSSDIVTDELCVFMCAHLIRWNLCTQ